MTRGQLRRGFRSATGFIAGLAWVFSVLTVSIWTVESLAAEPHKSLAAEPHKVAAVVGWYDVQAAFGNDIAASKPTVRRTAGEFAIEQAAAALPPPPSQAIRAAAMNVHPSSLAGISSSVIPAVTGDLYWSRPSLDMRVIGQSIGLQSTLYLSRPSVGVSVGSTSIPPFVGIK